MYRYSSRSDGLISVIPTIDKINDVKTEFFETDGRTTNKFFLEMSKDGSVISGKPFCFASVPYGIPHHDAMP